ncbi:hypothetical protein NDU88_003941 [Pleurodeles waltl]|uniref:Uncharacterized protein n=1 Tax=Pleurodeles waltl TaxID=8319 RepID=A0AAV7PDL0_PLEWA|nr:hypothetical protein NDU88_003941 [Pleurodeles waltl]
MGADGPALGPVFPRAIIQTRPALRVSVLDFMRLLSLGQMSAVRPRLRGMMGERVHKPPVPVKVSPASGERAGFCAPPGAWSNVNGTSQATGMLSERVHKPLVPFTVS